MRTYVNMLHIVLNSDGKSDPIYPINFLENDPDICDLSFRFVVDDVERESIIFTCDDIGLRRVLIVSINAEGVRSQIHEIEFTVSSPTDPIVFDVIPDRDIALNDIGSITVLPNDFVSNVLYPCDVFFLFVAGETDLPNLTYNCNDIGSHTVIIVATDGKGKRSQSREAKFTISDRTPPVFDVIPNRDVILNDVSSITIHPLDVVTNLSDNCSDKDEIVLLFVADEADHPNLTFICNDIGSSTVSVVAVDKNANRSQPQDVTFNISDQTPPVARCKPATLYLDAGKKTTLTAMIIDNGSTDNCGIELRQIKKTSDSDNQYVNSLSFDRDDLDVSSDETVSVTLRVTDDSGNEATCITVIRLEQLNPSDLGEIPTIFTPNGDGFNDTWEIPKIDIYPEAMIRIYNRTKKLMVELKGAQMPWDGRDRNGNLLDSGYYLYQIELHKGGKSISGYVTILR
jgi:gliding motility-associated-like protein